MATRRGFYRVGGPPVGVSADRNKGRIRIDLILGLVWIFGDVGWFLFRTPARRKCSSDILYRRFRGFLQGLSTTNGAFTL